MGTELIIGVAVQQHPERTVEELEGMVNNLDHFTADAIWSDVNGGERYSDIWETDDDNEVIEMVQGWLHEFLHAAGGGYSRNITVMQHPNIETLIAIGGGESWGDTPEGYDAIVAAVEWGEW